MDNIDIKTYAQLEGQFEIIFAECAHFLSEDSIKHVRYYIDHAELEMAVEGFCLDIMEANINIPKSTANALEHICIELELDRSQVYDDHFWLKWQAYIGRQQ